MSAEKILQPYRKKIDNIDDQIMNLLEERFDIVRQVGSIKTENDIVIVQTNRVAEVIQRNVEKAKKKNLNPDLIKCIYAMMIDYAHDLENAIKTKSGL